MAAPNVVRAATAAVLLLTGAAMAALTWRGWPDPFVDFGRELYVPWRLAEGDRLYTDVAWFNGPLSPYVNALLFRLFGPGLMVLAAANAVVLAAVVAMLTALTARISDRTTALAAGLLFLLVFGFGQYVGIANYNWISPYSHDLTHGIALALAAVWALDHWRRTGARLAPALSGLALGLCFLTKPETFLAGAAGCLALLAGPLRRREPETMAWMGAALLPPVVSALALGLPGTLGAWPSVMAGEVARLPFYRAGLGFDDPMLRLEETLLWGAVWGVGLFVPVSAAWLARETRSRWAPVLAFAVTAAILLAAGEAVPWTESLRPLQLGLLVVVAALAVPSARGAGNARGSEAAGEPDEDAVEPPTALALAVLALVLLTKMALNVRVGHYGFGLAAPAAVVMLVALLRWLPDLLDRRGVRGDVVRASVLGLLVVFCIAQVRTTAAWMDRKTERVGEGRDAFRADVRGAWIRMAAEHVREAGYGSIAVVPEGVLINYLARVPNPTPYVNFMPPEEILFGGAAWAAAFRAAPPDAIVIVPKDTSEFGRGPFGFGYGQELAAWIRETYVPEASLGVEGYTFEVRVLVRRNPPT